MRLKDKVAIVTGGGSGIGEAMCKRFVAEGALVAVVDRSAEGAQRVAAEIAEACGSGDRAVAVIADVTVDEDVRRAVGTTLSTFGRIDLLVNNAGISVPPGPMSDLAESDFDRLFAVNVKSLYLTARHVVPLLREQRSGAILNTASSASFRPRGNMVWYGGSKGAVMTLTQAMADELAPYGVRVNAVCPVSTETPMVMPRMTPERYEMFVKSIPLGRFGKPDDVANAAVYLLSDEASFITGVGLPVDGGRCI